LLPILNVKNARIKEPPVPVLLQKFRIIIKALLIPVPFKTFKEPTVLCPVLGL
jgi:hypothetical protein